MNNQELRLEWIDPKTLTPNPKNWRVHPPAQREALQGVLEEVGWAGALLFNQATGRLVDGHLRLDVALRENRESVPVLIGTWTEAQEKEILATLDPIAAMAEADSAQLDALLRDVNSGSAAVMDMLAGLAEDAGLYLDEKPTGAGGDEFDTTPQEGETRAKRGDLWQLGDHRLLVDDCTVKANVERLMGGEKAAVVTDPPYGVNCVANSNRLQELGYSQFVNDATIDTALLAFAEAQTVAKQQVWWGANHYANALPLSRGWLVWDKDHQGMDFGDGEMAWTSRDMPIRIFRHAWSGAHRASERGEQREHATQKPVALFEWCFEQVSAGNTVLDLFAGAGGCLIACERTTRRARLMEIEPQYADVILRRWEAETGLEAQLVERVTDGD